MFATIHPLRRPGDAVDDPRTVLPESAEPAGTVVVEHRGDGGGTVVALWLDEASAPGGRVYRVVDVVDGVAAGRTPLFGQLTWLNGTGDPAVAQAAERGGRERIRPAVQDVDGFVGALVLRSADHRIVVLGLATGLETHTAMQRRIGRTRLLPGEDPALLPGPDRVEVGRVLRADLPAEARR